MDPHTARCLQLSTSINMPFNPHRPYRYPDSVNRSRFPVNAPQPQMRTMSSTPLPAKGWPTPIIQNVYQNSYHHMPPTPQSAFVQQRPCIPAIHTGRSSMSLDMESPYYQPCFTPDERSLHEQWGPVTPRTPASGKIGRSSGLGLDFVDQRRDLTPCGLSATATESFEDMVRLDDLEPWDFNPVSPDRRSSSSLSGSSGDGFSDPSDLPEICTLSTLNADMSSGMGMTFHSDVSTPNHPHIDYSQPSLGTSGPPHAQSLSGHQYRSSLYSVSNRTRSSSTASTAPLSLPRTQCCSPLEECHEDFFLQDGDFQAGHHDQPMIHDGMFDDIHFLTEDFMVPKQAYPSNEMFVSPPFPEYHLAPPVLPSSGFFQISHDQGHHEDHNDHFQHDLADEPDLFGPLSEEQVSPSAEEMKPEDPDLEPRSQELRFEGDLYTPKFVRGHGNKREGYCGICKPGRWLVLKNSAFWYDKSFTHGISAATGLPFEGPKETRRMSGNPDVWEGLCGSCNEWIALISSKKKGTTWFRHAYKCHTHQKAKDTPKRRREPAQNRVSKSYKAKKAKHERRDNSPDSLGSPFEPVGVETAVSRKSASQGATKST